jgi:hypothetical protein
LRKKSPCKGTYLNPANRFDHLKFDEDPLEQNLNPKTTNLIDSSQTKISKNDSPDVGFDFSINPYRGCEHGCVQPEVSYLSIRIFGAVSWKRLREEIK